MTPSSTRRRLLSALSLALAGGVAGCSGTAGEGTSSPETATNGDDGDTSEETATTSTPEGEEPTAEDGTDATPTDSPEGATTAPQADDSTVTPDDELDLREANVVGVAIDGSGRYRFDVTLFHDDDGESGYADWWQVETLWGERLGRRTLLHAHSTAPFTRSEQITVPEDVTYVVVRGHDQTHGYGGQAMVVNVETGDSEAVRQGPEPRDFSAFEPRV